MDYVSRFLRVFAVIVLNDRAIVHCSPKCDQGRTPNIPEGNIGESALFPWVGVLRVHLHEGDSLKIALTGLVLVKKRYAIANADDVAKIPKTTFTQDSKAMFIAKPGEPWFSRLKDYMVHPEYQYTTLNTVALVELLIEDGEKVPIQPICWPGVFYNTTNQLYGIGYTDENKLLEKMFYKLAYVKSSLCKEFYEKSGLSNTIMAPKHLHCGFAKTNKKHCDFENGMALASNSTGTWTLIGISIRGPGCSAPARFLDVFPYLPWVESATDLEEISDFGIYRKHGMAVKAEANKTDNLIIDIPLHNTRRFFRKHNVDVDSMNPFTINRIDKDAIEVQSFHNKYEARDGSCSSHRLLVYKDQVRIVKRNLFPITAHYKVSLYNMAMSEYTCIKLKVNAGSRSKAHLWYRYALDPEDSFAHIGPETPDLLLKHYRPYKRVVPTTMGTTTPSTGESGNFPKRKPWAPGPHLEPKFITDTADYSGIRNLNLLLWFSFINEATLDVEVYGI